MPNIAIVGEAWGAEEVIAKSPFIGPSGQELTRMLKDAGINRGETFLTNVFNAHPPQNNIEFFLCSKGEGASALFKTPLVPGKYLKREFESELARLYKELETVQPNVVVLLGNTACWALLGDTKISKLRGAICYAKTLPTLKCLPTYHPAAILRQYELRHVTVLDLMKAKTESAFPEIVRPIREIWLDPTLQDIENFYKNYILTSSQMAFDIETNYGAQITCIGFSPSKNRALVIPIFDQRKPSGSYWDTLEEELEAWNWIAKIMNAPCKKVAQNGLFDLQYLWQQYGIPARNAGDDTMLLHHSLHPEAQKSLDFLGSVYCNEAAWKQARPRGKHTEKRNE